MARYIDDRPVIQRMRVRPYDKAAALLIASLIFAGFFDALMFFLWLTPMLDFGKDQVAIEIVLDIAGRGDHAEGYERDKEPPGVEELEEFMEPEVEMLLEAVTDVVSTTAAAWDSVATDATAPSHGTGAGDSRPPGPLGEGEDIIPEWERWELKYNTSTIDQYARQLDFFKIELGAVGGGHPQVDYAMNFSTNVKKRKGPGDAEQRIYFTWSEGKLKQYDNTLLSQSGIPTQRRIVCQFIPPSLRQNLLNKELQFAMDRMGIKKPLDQMTRNDYVPIFKKLAKTIFGVRRSGGKYEFYVISQRNRAGY